MDMKNEQPPLRANVLIVDDAAMMRNLFSRILSHEYDVGVAGSGEEALRILGGASLPDLILLDVCMPGQNGYEICRWIKTDPRLAEIPVVFLTSADDACSEVKGLEAGASDYIVKPVHVESALLRIRNLIELKRLRELCRAHGLQTHPNEMVQHD